MEFSKIYCGPWHSNGSWSEQYFPSTHQILCYFEHVPFDSCCCLLPCLATCLSIWSTNFMATRCVITSKVGRINPRIRSLVIRIVSPIWNVGAFTGQGLPSSVVDRPTIRNWPSHDNRLGGRFGRFHKSVIERGWRKNMEKIWFKV